MAKPVSPSKSEKSTRKNKSTLKSPFDRALKYLSFRPRSEKEMRDYLQDDPKIEEIISRLKELKFINDTEFTNWYIENRNRFRPRSKRMLALELQRKGIEKTELEPMAEDLNDVELAIQALAKKLRLWDKLPVLEFKVKATRFLASRGFSWGTIETVLKKRYNRDNVS